MVSRYWAKRFKDRKGPVTRSTNILGVNTRVPEIFVDDASSHRETSPLVPQILLDNEDIPPDFDISKMNPRETPSTPKRQAPPPLDPGGRSHSSEPPITFGSSSAAQFGDLDPFATFSLEESPSVLRQRPGRGRSPDLSPSGSPTGSPSMSPSMSPIASPRLGPQSSRTRDLPGNDDPPRQREGSEVMPRDVFEVLDSSEWGDQIRSYIESRSGNHPPMGQGGSSSPH